LNGQAGGDSNGWWCYTGRKVLERKNAHRSKESIKTNAAGKRTQKNKVGGA